MGGIRFKVSLSEEMRSTPIADVITDVRATNAMLRDGIKTVDDLVEKWNLLDGMRNVGHKTVSKIHNMFFWWYLVETQNTPKFKKCIDSMERVR